MALLKLSSKSLKNTYKRVYFWFIFSCVGLYLSSRTQSSKTVLNCLSTVAAQLVFGVLSIRWFCFHFFFFFRKMCSSDSLSVVSCNLTLEFFGVIKLLGDYSSNTKMRNVNQCKILYQCVILFNYHIQLTRSFAELKCF